MDTEERNGWTNVFTWLVFTNLTNDQHTDATLRDAAYAGARIGSHPVASAADAVEQWVRQEMEQRAPWLTAIDGLSQDLLGAALSQVDWREIAAAALEGTDLEPDPPTFPKQPRSW